MIPRTSARESDRNRLLCGTFRVGQKRIDSAKNPRRSMRAAADHYSVGASEIKYVARFLRLSISPLANTGILTERFDLANRVVLRSHLYKNPRASVRARQALECRPLRAMRAMRAPLRLAASHPVRILSVTGTFTALDHRLEQARDERFIFQQRRAAGLAAHFFRRTSHVDVDDLRAEVHVEARGFGERGGSEPASCTTRGSGSPCGPCAGATSACSTGACRR